MPAVHPSDEDIILVGTAHQDLLDEVTQALAEEGISIEGVTAVAVDEGSVVRLRVGDRAAALRILNQAADAGREYGRPTSATGGHAQELLSRIDYQQAAGEGVLVRLDNRPGQLAGLTHRCHEAGLRLRSVRILWRGKASAVFELCAADQEKLRQVLSDRVLLN